MAAPTPDPKHSPQPAETQTTDQDAASVVAPIDPHLLEKVLQETLAAMGTADTANSIDLQRLRSIAHRRQGQRLTLEPVAVEMVRALLGPNFAGLSSEPEVFLAMSTQVARSIMDDPTSCRRLENLWSRLCTTNFKDR